MDVETIIKGAEATISMEEFLGRRTLVKTRPPKAYRHPDLDSRLRSVRTRNEARIIREARMAGVRTPCIYDVDPVECSIRMEYIDGIPVKEVLEREPGRATEICKAIGLSIAKMHSAGICHGDLTTSNMILKDGEVCFIDFSMGCTKADLEDIGVDLRLLERAFTSTHLELMDAYDAMMEVYYDNMADPGAIKRKIEDIKGRGRYT